MTNAARYLAAMRADAIPAGEHGLWRVAKVVCDEVVRERCRRARRKPIPVGRYTSLIRTTLATMNSALGGETVMVDEPGELRKHLQAVRCARGRVLVTGLGLGCVVRGMLANPAVEHIDVIERDESVLALVRAFMGKGPRLTIHHAEAEAWLKAHQRKRWDVVWHDVWTDTEQGEPHLQVTHMHLLYATMDRAEWQGAWAFPRRYAREVCGYVEERRSWGEPRKKPRKAARRVGAAMDENAA